MGILLRGHVRQAVAVIARAFDWPTTEQILETIQKVDGYLNRLRFRCGGC
jgi:hypothetical protein